MRLHHLHVGYLDKASSSPLSSTSPPFPSSSFPVVFQCLRPLAPKVTFLEAKKMVGVSPDFALAKNASKLNCTVQVPAAGTTRWNPSAEQIKLLEMLYRGGMRTPNAFQIERITEELGKYGRIEGKNVFYWFQNHKARERQKQKRAALLTLSTLDSSSLQLTDAKDGEKETCDDTESCKRRCKTWGDGDAASEVADSTVDATLELFPLRPQGKV